MVYSKRLWWRNNDYIFHSMKGCCEKNSPINYTRKKDDQFSSKKYLEQWGFIYSSSSSFFFSSFCENSQLIPFVLLYFFIWCFHGNHTIIKNTDYPKMFSSHENRVRRCLFQNINNITTTCCDNTFVVCKLSQPLWDDQLTRTDQTEESVKKLHLSSSHHQFQQQFYEKAIKTFFLYFKNVIMADAHQRPLDSSWWGWCRCAW